MDFVSIFFMIMSLSVLFYFIGVLKSGRRVAIIVEIFYVFVYVFVFIIFLYPQILRIIEDVLGIQSAINFIVYLSIFVAYFVIFLLYRKIDDQRVDITKLVREIAFLKQDKKSVNKKKLK